MQELIFEEDGFSKASGFYKEKDGKWQEKTAEIIVKCLGGTQEKICEATLNLASYIGRGLVKERVQLSGAAYFIDFEISVIETSAAVNVRGSMATPLHHASDEENDTYSSGSPNPRLQSEAMPKTSSDNILGAMPAR